MSTSSGENWRKIRTFTTGLLREFGFGRKSLQSQVRQEIELFLGEVEKKINKPYNCKHLLQISVSNIICSIIFGERFDYNDKNFITMMDEMNEILRLQSGASMLNFFPFLRYLPGDPFKMKRLETLLDNELRRIDVYVDAHKKVLNPAAPRDYIDKLLIERNLSDWMTGQSLSYCTEFEMASRITCNWSNHSQPSPIIRSNCSAYSYIIEFYISKVAYFSLCDKENGNGSDWYENTCQPQISDSRLTEDLRRQTKSMLRVLV